MLSQDGGDDPSWYQNHSNDCETPSPTESSISINTASTVMSDGSRLSSETRVDSSDHLEMTSNFSFSESHEAGNDTATHKSQNKTTQLQSKLPHGNPFPPDWGVTRLTVFPLRQPLDGENKPWDVITGRETTAPRRKQPKQPPLSSAPAKSLQVSSPHIHEAEKTTRSTGMSRSDSIHRSRQQLRVSQTATSSSPISHILERDENLLGVQRTAAITSTSEKASKERLNSPHSEWYYDPINLPPLHEYGPRSGPPHFDGTPANTTADYSHSGLGYHRAIREGDNATISEMSQVHSSTTLQFSSVNYANDLLNETLRYTDSQFHEHTEPYDDGLTTWNGQICGDLNTQLLNQPPCFNHQEAHENFSSLPEVNSCMSTLSNMAPASATQTSRYDDFDYAQNSEMHNVEIPSQTLSSSTSSAVPQSPLPEIPPGWTATELMAEMPINFGEYFVEDGQHIDFNGNVVDNFFLN
jgi:hypothetical protein